MKPLLPVTTTISRFANMGGAAHVAGGRVCPDRKYFHKAAILSSSATTNSSQNKATPAIIQPMPAMSIMGQFTMSHLAIYTLGKSTKQCISLIPVSITANNYADCVVLASA